MENTTLTVPRWSLDEIPFPEVELELVKNREDLFYLVTSASFVEISADLYTDNLIHFFKGSDDVVQWLEEHWQHEEVRHGRSLRAYIAHVWPEFDWQAAYDAFFADYSRLCTVEQLEASQTLEMVARCVVETGTATFYQALAHQATEPVLAGIAMRIRADEIKHYKYFYHYFRLYNASEPTGRLRILGTLKRRLLEVRNEDAQCALWHVFLARQPQAAGDKQQFQTLCKRLVMQVRNDYPVSMAAKMLLRPLDLPASLARLIEGPVARITIKFML